MIGQGLMAGWRRAAGLLALLAVAALLSLAQPPHTEAKAMDAPAAAAAHQADDPDGGHHPPDAHCASHCASHTAATPERGSTLAAATFGGAHRYDARAESAPRALTQAPPIRPPAA